MTTLFFLFDKYGLTLEFNYKLKVDKVCGCTLEWRLDRFHNLFTQLKVSRKQFYGIPFCDTYLHGIGKQLDDLDIWNYSSKQRFNCEFIS
jgi:hypothetical protein